MWHVAAAGITGALVLTGFDWHFFEATRSAALYPLIMLAGIGGFLVPVLLPLALYVWGRRGNERYTRAAIATAKAAAVSWVIIAVYKALTGRVQPEFASGVGVDISRGFQFGFFEHGIFWGWPSHHTAVAFAVAAVLYLTLRNSAARAVAVAWAIVVAAGASVGFHWFSDVVAGAIVGAVVGVAVWQEVNRAGPAKQDGGKSNAPASRSSVG